ncbi:MAG: DUF2975 domain-containing protein [Clostridia bacterium]|nr:DUF2975 domain-containing protein [Clostridia bacterium]
MWNSKKSVNLSIVVCFILSAILVLLAIFGPMVFKLYMTAYRGFLPAGDAMRHLSRTFVLCFYPSAVFAGIILYSLLKLLFNIKGGQVFINQNVTLLRVVSWCCIAIAIITFVGAFFYMPFGFVALAGGFVGIMLRVLKNVMQSAVELREENDLTI